VVLVNGDASSARSVWDEEYTAITSDEIDNLFRGVSDLVYLKNATAATAFRTLENEWNKDCSLHLILILLSGRSHLRARRLAAQALEDLLRNEVSLHFVMNRLYSAPLPDGADIEHAIALAREVDARMLGVRLLELRANQPRIASVREAWERLPINLFGTLPNRRLLDGIAADDGLFYGLAHPSRERLFGAISQWFENHEVLNNSHGRAIVDAWIAQVEAVPRKEQSSVPDQLALFESGSQ
jgi:hypothetical protein